MVVHRLITHRVFFVAGVLVLGMLAAACGGGSVSKNQPISSLSPTPTPTPNASPTATPPANPSPTPSSSKSVVIVLEENHSLADVIGNPAMPYVNGLAAQFAVAADYYADTHPSIGNYFELTTGAIVTNDDNFTGTINADNLVREIQSADKTWKAYAESLPHAGYVGGDVYPYAKHHNPFVYFSDVLSSTQEQANLVPFSQFASDLASSSLPAFSYVVPNLNDDAHDCPAGESTCTDTEKLAAADQWLQANIAPLLANANFKANGLLLIVFDEGLDSDLTNGGGHTFLLAAAANARKNYQSPVLYQHQNTLRTVCDTLGLANCPGDGA